MRQNETGKYQYVMIKDYFFCLQQPWMLLFHTLFLKRSDLLSITPWFKKSFPPWKFSYYRHCMRIFWRNISVLMKFWRLRNDTGNKDVISLPVYGQVGVAVHKGYKVFDFYRGLVSKAFDSDVSEETIRYEIEKMKNVSDIGFAPRILKWDMQEKWYEEEYVRGDVAMKHRTSNSSVLLNAFKKEALPCMEKLVVSRPSSKVDLSLYSNQIKDAIDIQSLSGDSIDPEAVRELTDFIEMLNEEVETTGDNKISIVFSHGDFCPANILHTGDGIKIVDWETNGERSLFFDFYSYFFHRSVSGRMPLKQVVKEISKALPQFISRMEVVLPEVKETIARDIDAYRKVYYLEFLRKLVDRYATDKRLDIAAYITGYIKTFKEYEKMISSPGTSNIIQEDLFRRSGHKL